MNTLIIILTAISFTTLCVLVYTLVEVSHLRREYKLLLKSCARLAGVVKDILKREVIHIAQEERINERLDEINELIQTYYDASKSQEAEWN